MTTVPQASPEQKQLATVKYQPLEQVGDTNTLKGLLERMKESLKETLPLHVTPDRLIKTMLVAANRQPKLLQCTQASIMETVSRAGELGLDLSGTLGEAYPVPFDNNVDGKWLTQCQLIIGYRGLAKLARQSGEVQDVDAQVVYEHDKFEFEKGLDPKLRWVPEYFGERGRIRGAYSVVRLKDGGVQFDFMPVPEIEAIRKRSKSGTDKKTGEAKGPWKNDWNEMAKKTVFRRLAKWLPLSAEKANAFVQALEADSADFNMDTVVNVEATELPNGSRTEALAAKLKPAPEPEYDDIPPHDPETGEIIETTAEVLARESKPEAPKSAPKKQASTDEIDAKGEAARVAANMSTVDFDHLVSTLDPKAGGYTNLNAQQREYLLKLMNKANQRAKE